MDEEVATLSAHARLLYMGLWGICDDNYATLPNKPGWIKIQVFPYESVSIPPLLDELERIGKLIRFQAQDSEWWYIKNFFKYQKVDRPSKPKYPQYKPSLVLLDESSTTTRPEEKRREENMGATRVELVSEEEKQPKTPPKYPHSREVFGWFPKPEPSWKLNTTELKHSELLWERGEEKVKGALRYCAAHKDDSHFYQVTKPSDLERKWEDIKQYAGRN